MDGKSLDIIKNNVRKLKNLFPEVVTEMIDRDGNITHKIDALKLSLLLGEETVPVDDIEYANKFGEKYSFEWYGKKRAIQEALKRSTGTLRPCEEDSVNWNNTENIYIEGDNLEVLKLLQDSYLGAVKMIYIDPPYNTGKDFVYKDNYRDNLSNYLEQTNTTNAVNSEASGRYHTNWLNMIYPRLKLAHNLLADDGVIFISIDDNEIDNLKKVCNEIFGEDKFVAQFPWRKRTAKSDVPFGVSQDYEWIVCYANNLYNACVEGNPRKYYESEDFPGKPWRIHDMTKQTSASERPNSYFTMVNPKNGEQYPCSQNSTWRITEDTFEKYYNENKIVFPGEYDFLRISKPVMRYFKKDDEAKSGDLFGYVTVSTNLPAEVGMSQDGTKDFAELFQEKSFSFPKPVGLIKYLLKISRTKDNNYTVLDFFSGSATTAQAVMQLNAEDKGTRKYICVQLPEPTPEDSEARKAKFNTIPEIAKERIRRAGKKIVEEQKAKNDGLFADEVAKLDIGFKVFKLDRSNVKEWDVEFDGLSETQAAQALSLEFSKAMDILKDGRTELDLLYEVILKLGLQLSTTVETKLIEDKTVFVVGHGVMIASFAKGLTSNQISKMVDLKADFVQAGEFKVVLSDESFASDNDKTNAMQLFKQRGITNYEII